MKNIGEIAEVRAGYTVRKPEKGVPTVRYRVLQIKDVTADAALDTANLATMNLPPVSDRYFLKHGDILFCARGARNRAAVSEVEMEQVVVGAQFFVIQVKGDRLLPRYVAWYINQPTAQQYFSERASGSYVRMILVDDLLHLPVPVPPLKVQQQIAALHQLGLREQNLLERLRVKRMELLNGLCIDVAGGHKRISKGV
jgi:hypothetical protein